MVEGREVSWSRRAMAASSAGQARRISRMGCCGIIGCYAADPVWSGIFLPVLDVGIIVLLEAPSSEFFA